jgi:endothelin-converting enzyme
MNEDKIKEDGVKPLLEILGQVADMFPAQAIPKTTLKGSDKEDIAGTILFLAKLGVTSLVALGAGADDKDPDEVVVQVAPPYRIGLPAKDYYTDDSVVQKYENALSQVIQQLHTSHDGTGRFLASNKSDAHGVVEFEKKLAAASPDAEDQNDVTVRF